MHPPRIAAALLITLLAGPARAAPLPDLLSSVPAPPGDVATALSWVRDGAVAAPAVLAFRQQLAAERQTLTDAGAAAPAQPNGAAGASPASVVEQRVVQGYNAYTAQTSGADDPRHLLGKRTRWVQKAMGGQQLRISQSMQSCADPCADPAVLQHNQEQLERRRRTLETELKMWDALFADWQAKRSGYVADAEERLAALGDPAAVADPSVRAVAVRYRSAMLDEIDLLLSITELAVRRAAAIDHGLDGSEPDSISGATRKVSTR